MKNHLIIDFETIGVSPTKSPIVNCSYMIFDFERFLKHPYSLEELVQMTYTKKFNVKRQVEEYRKEMTERDLNFWKELPKNVRSQIKPSSTDLSYEEFMEQFFAFVSGAKIERWWCRGSNFDGALLEMIAATTNNGDRLYQFLSPFKCRDIRTYIDAKFNFELMNSNFCPYEDEAEWNKVYRFHDSAYDISADVLRLQLIEHLTNG